MNSSREVTPARPVVMSTLPAVVAAAACLAAVSLLSSGPSWVLVAAPLAVFIAVFVVVGLVWPGHLAAGRGPEVLEAAFGAPVLLALPRSGSGKATAPAMLIDGPVEGPVADAYRQLRSMLSRLDDVQRATAQHNGLPRRVDEVAPVVLVTATSEVGLDERLAAAGNLAIAAASASRQVTLVEADLVRPGLTRMFGIGAHPGVGDAGTSLGRRADGTPDLRPFLQPTIVPGLFGVGEGTQPTVPSNALSQIGRFMAALALDSDVVVVHGPPLDRLDDVIELLAYTDQLVVVAGPDAAVEQVRGVRRLVDQLHAPLAGVLLAPRARATAHWRPSMQAEASAVLTAAKAPHPSPPDPRSVPAGSIASAASPSSVPQSVWPAGPGGAPMPREAPPTAPLPASLPSEPRTPTINPNPSPAAAPSPGASPAPAPAAAASPTAPPRPAEVPPTPPGPPPAASPSTLAPTASPSVPVVPGAPASPSTPAATSAPTASPSTPPATSAPTASPSAPPASPSTPAVPGATAPPSTPAATASAATATPAVRPPAEAPVPPSPTVGAASAEPPDPDRATPPPPPAAEPASADTPDRVWDELGELLDEPAPTPGLHGSGPISVDEALAEADDESDEDEAVEVAGTASISPVASSDGSSPVVQIIRSDVSDTGDDEAKADDGDESVADDTPSPAPSSPPSPPTLADLPPPEEPAAVEVTEAASGAETDAVSDLVDLTVQLQRSTLDAAVAGSPPADTANGSDEGRPDGPGEATKDEATKGERKPGEAAKAATSTAKAADAGGDDTSKKATARSTDPTATTGDESSTPTADATDDATATAADGTVGEDTAADDAVDDTSGENTDRPEGEQAEEPAPATSKAAGQEEGVIDLRAIVDAATMPLADEEDATSGVADLTVLDDAQFDLLAELEDEDDLDRSRR
ncbi:MAG: hypothetical protein AAF962_00190 [Actinomycetota bacterium]